MVKRTRYQYGSVEIDKCVNGPDVWLYHWWESTSDGRRTRRGFTVGTVEEYKTEAHALKAAEGMRLIINDGSHNAPRFLSVVSWIVFFWIRNRNRSPNKSPTTH